MAYAELHCRSNFSFLRAASHPEELVAQAASLGYTAIAITDENSVAGMARAHGAAKELGFHLIVGAEITPVDAPSVVLWVQNRTGYARLCSLITKGRRSAPKGEFYLQWEEISPFTEGLIAGVVPDFNAPQSMPAWLARYKSLFPDRCYLLAELQRGPHDQERLAQLQDWSQRADVPLLVSGGVLFHVPARQALQDVVTAIRHSTTVVAAGDLLHPNAERHLKALTDIAVLYAEISGAIERTAEIAQRCTFSLDELRYEYPEELAPAGIKPVEHLRELTWHGAQERYPEVIPPTAQAALQHELALIEELHYEAYFLTVWDLVRFARSRNILCQGRGSAANSVVCYCLGITSVSPERANLLFERFISRERNEAPDIDIDFEHERREEVLQYVYDKYGRERTGMTAVTTTYRSRSAIRDVGKAIGLSLDLVDRIAKNGDGHRDTPDLAARCQEVGFDPCSELGRRFIYLVCDLIGFPRHLSQHVGGMVISHGPLHELVPIENAAMEGRTVIQWNKDDLDELGILKVDCLALGMLTAIRKCFALVKQTTGKEWTLATVPEEDSQVYDMICRADTMGVFQIESRAQMSMLPRLKPRKYYDLVIEVAIVRPGPIQGQMVHPYLRRRCGDEQVSYPNAAIEAVLEKTLGVPLFQEQCMKLAVVAAGFTPGEADQLRRAMGAWRKTGVIDQFRQKLLVGMRAQGLTEEFAEQVFKQIRGFGEYGFPESHAASFALLVYVSAWLKHYYPAAFTAALINGQPMGFYAVSQLVQDAQKHGVEIQPVDVNYSHWDCTLERGALRLGLRLIAGLAYQTAVSIEQSRPTCGFRSYADFCQRTQLAQSQIIKLADADALRSLEPSRRTALWQALEPSTDASHQLFDLRADHQEVSPELPELSLQAEVHADYRTTSLTLRPHPLSFHREALQSMGITAARDLATIANDTQVTVAGLILLRQRPSTAKGITFVLLEDETGTVNLVLHQTIWEKFRAVTRHSSGWIAHGRLESKDTVIHLIVQRLEDLKSRLFTPQIKSRDFR